MDKFSYLNDISKADNLRLYILEHTLQIEETTSKTLGYILDIDWEKSKSFSYSSVAFSFNQKIQIIQDLKGLDNTDKQKLTVLMTIRNKFAHVKSINTFNDLFNIESSGKEVKKNLDKWYSDKSDFGITDDEFRYKVFFYWLFLDVSFILIKKIGEDAIERGKKAGELDLLIALKEELLKLPNGPEILSKTAEKIKAVIKNI
jgi:hypothetical protein